MKPGCDCSVLYTDLTVHKKTRDIDSTDEHKRCTGCSLNLFPRSLPPVFPKHWSIRIKKDDDFTPATYFSRDNWKIRADHYFILLMVYSAVE